MTKTPITLRGADLLREELKRLKGVDRPKVIADIAEARAHGDLKENAEYHAAREQQGFIEGRIQEIEAKLGTAQVIDVLTLPKTGKVVFGTTVDLVDVDTDDEMTYQIVGEDEADVKNGRIAFSTPIARGLLGKAEGDEVSVDVPGGTRTFEILGVRYE
ncbi:MAG: transcription elongation factor GreA [Oceanococcaceae bacterium]